MCSSLCCETDGGNVAAAVGGVDVGGGVGLGFGDGDNGVVAGVMSGEGGEDGKCLPLRA